MDDPFLLELAKAQPNPGGGAAAAYGAGVALALLTKVVKLERQRPKHDDQARRFWDERLDQVQRLREELARLRDEDVQAYMNLARSLREGGDNLTAVVEEAIDCPRRIMAGALQGLQAVAAAGEKCRPHLISDLQVAGEFLGAALCGAYRIAAANLPLIASHELRQNHAGDLDALFDQGDAALQEVRRLLAARTSPADGP